MRKNIVESETKCNVLENRFVIFTSLAPVCFKNLLLTILYYLSPVSQWKFIFPQELKWKNNKV